MKIQSSVLCVLLSSIAAAGQNSTSKPIYLIDLCAAPPTVNFGSELVCGEPAMKLGSPVVVTVRFTNNSDQVVDASGMWNELTRNDPNFQFDVRDSRGKLVSRRHYPHEELAGGSVYFRDIPPGKSLTENVDLSRIYDFQMPGVYSVRVSRSVSLIPKELGNSSIKSKVITVTLEKSAETE
jgi:hypothetical protein